MKARVGCHSFENTFILKAATSICLYGRFITPHRVAVSNP